MKCVARMTISSFALLTACVAENQASPPIISDGGQTNARTLEEKHGTELVGSAVRDSSSITAEDVIDAPNGSGAIVKALPYERGTVYQLRAAVGAPGTIALQPGETLVNYAAGDGEVWIIDAANVDDRTRLRIEPTRPDLRTPLLINTDRRSYLVEASSQQEGAAATALAWTYPHDPAALATEVVESETPPETDDETAFSWADLFAAFSVSTSNDPRGCRLCRDPDDHGDNDHGRDHDRGDRGGMH